MPRVLVVVLVVALTVFVLVTIVQARRDEVRHLPRWVWFLVVLLLPVVGLLAWLIFGRPLPHDDSGDQNDRGDWPVRPRAPDDDADFLRSL